MKLEVLTNILGQLIEKLGYEPFLFVLAIVILVIIGFVILKEPFLYAVASTFLIIAPFLALCVVLYHQEYEMTLKVLAVILIACPLQIIICGILSRLGLV